MVAGFALAMALATQMEPASLEIVLDTNTEVAIYLHGVRLEPGVKYHVQPFNGKRVLSLEIRYVNEDRVCTRTMNFEIEAGFHNTWTLKLQANPPKVFNT